MGLSLKNDVCLWVVPPNSGRVRKVRFSIRFLIAVLLTISLMGGTFLFITGDYTRVQLSRLKNYLSLKSALEELDGLKQRARELKSKVASLRSANQTAQDREKEIQERLSSLAVILKSVPFQGPLKLDDKSLSKQAPKAPDRGGIGGAELDCSGVMRGECSALLEESDKGRRKMGLAPLALQAPAQDDLIVLLDTYIDNLRRLPFGSPVSSQINSGFGYRLSPFEGSIRMHEGVDFAMPYGSSVFATADGLVTRAEFDGTYGLLVDVSHGNGMTTRYAHLSRASVRKGDTIERGEILGYVGSSGRSTGPHLHYEVLVQGSPRDPEIFIALARKLASALSV